MYAIYRHVEIDPGRLQYLQIQTGERQMIADDSEDLACEEHIDVSCGHHATHCSHVAWNVSSKMLPPSSAWCSQPFSPSPLSPDIS